MKKILFLLILMFSMVILASCGKGSDESTPEQSIPVEPTIPEQTVPGGNPTIPQPTVPGGDPVVPQPTVPEVDPNAPTLAPGWVDAGYSISTTGSGYTISKSASAALWTGAILDVTNYSSEYSSFTVRFTTTNVTTFSIELIVSGGEPDWADNVSVYQATLEDGEHEITVDFSNVLAISTTNWDVVPGHYIKDYTIAGVKFSLDTSTVLVDKDATCDIHELAFVKVEADEPTVPGGDPITPVEPDSNAPTIAPGWIDTGYSVSNANGEYTITKAATAGLWTGAMFDISNYTSAYSAFTVKFSTTGVSHLVVELIVKGGEADWSEYVTVYQEYVTDGEHEITIDFTNVPPVSTITWGNVEGYFIKDYNVSAVRFSLDTSVELIAQEGKCVIHDLTFDKVGTDEPSNPDDPVTPPVDEPTVPEEVDPNAPTLTAGWVDSGYQLTNDPETGDYTVKKLSTAGQWHAATLNLVNYTKDYSAFTLRITTTNVKNISVVLLFDGGEADWSTNVTLYQADIQDGKHEIYIDFSEVAPVSTTNWQSVPGYYVKDYNVTGIQFLLDTAVYSVEDLIAEEAYCLIRSLVFEKVETPEEPDYSNDVYEPSNTTLSFSNENESRVVTEPTFDVTQYTANAATSIKPYQLFGSGMCLQRDAINRIWGTSTDTNNIAIEFKGKVYYGTVTNGEWEVYLPKMNAGGPYKLTIISEAGRIILTNVYVGEVFLLSGQSNMEYLPTSFGDTYKDLYNTKDCVNNEIRMFQVGWHLPTEPSTEGIMYSIWTGANQTTIPAFSIVGYLFGKQMQEELGCPVGLISNPVGGSSIEFWLSEGNYNKVQEIYTSYKTEELYMTPCLGYNGRLYPLAGLNIRGVVWYQGESNAFGTQDYYDKALEIYMEQCREMFNNEQLAFTICELARYEYNPYAYSTINEKINKVAANDPYTVVARNLDLGDWNDIHPATKKEIAQRAADETLRVFFNIDKPDPITVTEYAFNEDGSVTITLSANASLVNGTNGFEVCVNGSYSYNCNVVIEGNTLTVTADGQITAVRYGYTSQMTSEIQKDVSKMVTVYDEHNMPLDLFWYTK